jgi:lipoate synthase
VRGGIGPEPSSRLLELALAGLAAAGYARVMHGNRNVDEALVEVTLPLFGGSPDVLQRLVRSEILTAAYQLETVLELGLRRRPRSRGP